MPELVRVGPVGRIVLAVVAIAVIVGTFVTLAKDNLRLTAANVRLTAATTLLMAERDELKSRLEDELTKRPVTLLPGLVKPAAPLGETRWMDGRYVIIPPITPPAPSLTAAKRPVEQIPPTPPGMDKSQVSDLPLAPGCVPDVDGTVINQPSAVKYDPKRDGSDTVHPVPTPVVPKAHPVVIPGYKPAAKK